MLILGIIAVASSQLLAMVYNITGESGILLHHKDQATLRFKANPKTGYYWKLNFPENTQLQSNGPNGEYFEPKEDLPNSPGHQDFVIKCAGECDPVVEKLTFVISRNWDEAVVKSIDVYVQVVFDPPTDPIVETPHEEL